jgi:hypothetical protein
MALIDYSKMNGRCVSTFEVEGGLESIAPACLEGLRLSS